MLAKQGLRRRENANLKFLNKLILGYYKTPYFLSNVIFRVPPHTTRSIALFVIQLGRL